MPHYTTHLVKAQPLCGQATAHPASGKEENRRGTTKACRQRYIVSFLLMADGAKLSNHTPGKNELQMPIILKLHFGGIHR
jgi:hypothetical protein